jgi:hypothetical protein
MRTHPPFGFLEQGIEARIAIDHGRAGPPEHARPDDRRNLWRNCEVVARRHN